MPNPDKGRQKVFISYSHKDSKWLKRLQTHLRDLERRDLVELWDDTRIRPGEEWRKEIRDALESARAAVLLISADFVASDFIAEKELPPLLAAAENDGVTILPLILSPSLFEEIESLARFQTVNPPSKPLIKLKKGEQEEYLVKLSKAVLRAVETAEKNPAASDIEIGGYRFAAVQMISPAEDNNPYESPGDELADNKLQAKVRRLANASEPQSVRPDDIRAVAREVENYDVPEVWVEQESHLKKFVGREAMLTRLRNWVDTSQDGGYFLLLGPWGQGKSALLAQLAERSKNEGLARISH